MIILIGDKFSGFFMRLIKGVILWFEYEIFIYLCLYLFIYFVFIFLCEIGIFNVWFFGNFM